MKTTLIGRMNRLIGQLQGIKKMLSDSGQKCEDVAIQFKAAIAALESIFRDYLHTNACQCTDKEKLKKILDMIVRS